MFGPYMHNFREIRDMFLDADAAIEVNSADQLATTIERLITDRSFAEKLGSNARRLVEQNTGATERVLAYLQ